MIRVLLCSLALVFISTPAFSAVTVGFEKGNSFTTADISGDLTITCRDMMGGGSKTVFVHCYDSPLSPYESGYLVSSGAIDADKVELVATQADGKVEKKSSKWDAKKNRSSSRFNLWIDTLTQNNLLDEGKNVVAYTFTKKGQAVLTGSFDATIDREPARTCEPDWYNSTNSRDCSNPSFACDSFFYNQNDCR